MNTFKNTSFNPDRLELDFINEITEEKHKGVHNYKILVVDDDEVVHQITKLSLRNLSFEIQSIQLIHLYSMKEAHDYLQYNTDIAVMLLDVVMETDDAGLRLVKVVREELKNDRIRIILRTGHPGLAPEERIMLDYDINDYRAKTDLTATSLSSAVTGCLRNYRDIMKINSYKLGLEKVIHSTSLLFNYESLGLTSFLNGILEQLVALINSQNTLVLVNRHFENGRLITHEGDYRVIAATGDFKPYINEDLEAIKKILGLKNCFEENIEKNATQDALNKVDESRKFYLGIHKPTIKSHTESYIYIINGEITTENESFINLFLKNLSLSLDNFLLEQDTDEALYEMLSRMSSIVEARDGETGTHVYRVAEISSIIAKAVGFEKSELRDFKIASMMHDVGKIGIRDSVLLKPGKLTDEEFEYIKTHTTIGSKLFNKSNHQLLKFAKQISHYHHEKWNGTGYPDGLVGEEIPIYARIVSITDVFDALSHDRVYKKAWSIEASKTYIIEQRGLMFDPRLVDVFIENFDKIIKVLSHYEKMEKNADKEHE